MYRARGDRYQRFCQQHPPPRQTDRQSYPKTEERTKRPKQNKGPTTFRVFGAEGFDAVSAVGSVGSHGRRYERVLHH